MHASIYNLPVSTVVLRIRNLSHLMNFTAIVQQENAFCELLAEFLRLGYAELLYSAYAFPKKSRYESWAETPDSALITVCLPGREVVRKDPVRTMRMTLRELLKPHNRLSINSGSLGCALWVRLSVFSSKGSQLQLCFPAIQNK